MHACDLCQSGIGVRRVGPSVKEVEYLDGARYCDSCATTFCSNCAGPHDAAGCGAYWNGRELRAS